LPLNKSDFGYDEVRKMLTEIEPETILFLSKLRKIKIKIDCCNDFTILKDDSKEPHIKILTNSNNQDDASNYLLFKRTFKKPQDIIHEKRNGITEREVSIAFPIGENPKGAGKLFAYLPVRSDTGFPFIINADFILPSTREDIQDLPWNRKWLMECVALLLSETFLYLKQENELSVTFLELLSKRLLTINDSSIYSPLAKEVYVAFIKKELLPVGDDTFVSVGHAKLARGMDLRKLLGHAQLGVLFNSNCCRWLSDDITVDRTPNLRKYLLEQHNVVEIRPEKFAELLTDDFLEQQNDEWIIRFYSFLGKDKSELWKKPDAILKKKKILRLEDNLHVTPFKSDGTPNAYLPSSGNTNFPTIKKDVFADNLAADFLRNLGIIEPDSFAEVIEFVLPKYVVNNISVSRDENIVDIRKTIRLINDPHLGNSSSNVSKLRILLTKLGLSQFEEMFSSIEPKTIILLFKMVLPTIKFIRSTNGIIEEYRSPNDVYLISSEFESYLKDNSDIWFACSDYPDELILSFKELGINTQPKVIKKAKDSNGYVDIRSWHGSHKRGLDGFDPDWSIAGLQQAIEKVSVKSSFIIWNIIKLHACCIRGIVESSSRQNFQDSKKKEEISGTGNVLVRHQWLPDKSGVFHKPSELQLTDLPDEFDKHSIQARELAEKLGMRKPEHQQALDTLAHGNQRLKKCLEALQNADDSLLDKIEKLIPSNKIISEFPSFKEGLDSLHRSQRRTSEQDSSPLSSPVSDPARYQDQLDNEVIDEIEDAKKPRRERFSIVRESSANRDARDFLYQEYVGRCQVTGDTFNKANGQNYFVAVCLVPRLNAEHLNHQGNMLCLSAETAAKLMYASFSWLDDLKTKIQDFKAEIDGGNELHRKLRINLAGQDATITWTERHFMRLKALWDNA
jgi:hypothetical protein